MAVRGPTYAQLPQQIGGGVSNSGSGDQWRSFMPSLLVGQLLFWLLLASLYLSYSSSGESPDSAILRHTREKEQANTVKINEQLRGLPGADQRGWIMSPLHAAAEFNLGGAKSCIDVHVGTIGPLKSRANHRHHTKNESFLVWGAHAKWRIENTALDAAFAEVEFKDSDISVMTAPAGRAHALLNLDKTKTLFLVVCADTEWNPKHPDTDYQIWTDLLH